MNGYEKLFTIENELRNLIKNELSKITTKWWKQRIPEDVRRNAHDRKDVDKERGFQQIEDYPLIQYVDFTDYEKIIIKNDNWNDVFKNIFKDKNAISVKLKELEPIRRAIGHSRKLSKEDKERLRFYSEEILKAISYYYDSKEKIIKRKEMIKEEKEYPPVSITVSFDRSVYPIQSTIHLRANVPTIITGKPIIFQIFNNNELLITKEIKPEEFEEKQVAPDAGIYELSFKMDDRWKVGETYTLKGIHGTSEASDETTIEARMPIVQSDKSVYLWGSDMILTVIDPDADKDSYQHEFVGDREDSFLLIKSSKGELKNYRLRETGDSTGIFQGLVGFIGKYDDGSVEGYNVNDKLITSTQGNEYNDGFIEVGDNDELSIEYSNRTRTSKLTVFVKRSTLPSDNESHKEIVKQWTNGQISDSQYLQKVQELINQGIILPFSGSQSEYNPNKPIPAWVKNNAKWWSNGQITDEDYRSGLEYLYRSGFLKNL